MTLCYLTFGSSIALLSPLAKYAVVAIATIFLLASPVLLRISPPMSLFMTPAQLPQLPLSLGILRLPALL